MINSAEMQRGLKWLITFRIFFSIILIFSTLIFSTNESMPFDSRPFVAIYFIALLMLCISVIYGLLFKKFSDCPLFAYLQLAVDSITVSAIILVTGGFQSIFTFLYILVIIAASMLLLRKGALIVAALCSIQYGILIDLEYYGFISPLISNVLLASNVEWSHIIYRLIIIMASSFVVALLSGYLAFQAKIAKKELKLMEDNLKRVEKLATMGELAAGMAHEIKNPLASLSGAIQMLKEDSDPGTPNYKLMQIVLRETERLSSIVTDFLLFARPSTIHSKKVMLANEIEETVRLFKQDALCQNSLQSSDKTIVELCSNQIEFVINLDNSLSINIDPDHFRQIIWNLIKNAAEAIRSREFNNSSSNDDDDISTVGQNIEYSSLTSIGCIGIRLFKSRDKVILRVSDNGCGIKKADVESIFNPFFTTKSYGTGLGLSIIHRLIDSYNGLIDIESEPGIGTTFTVIFKEG